MRRAIILLIAPLIALLFSNVSMFTYAKEYTAQIGFSQQEHTVPLNNTFEVSIMLLQTDIPLGALQFEVHYPQDLLLFEGYNVTTSIPVLCEMNYLQPGKINIGMIVNVNMTDGALTSGELLRLKFTATSLGNGTMQLIPVDASDVTTNITVALYGTNATIRVIPLRPLPGYGTPTDPDGDGLYEDLNGNGRVDFNDVVLLFQYMEFIQQNWPVSVVDFNGNGRLDFNDIVVFFQTEL